MPTMVSIRWDHPNHFIQNDFGKWAKQQFMINTLFLSTLHMVIKRPTYIKRPVETNESRLVGFNRSFNIGRPFNIHVKSTYSKALCNRSNSADTFSKPGHMFPIVANPGGVLARPGHSSIY